MGPDYSKAKNVEEARAIKKAFWDQIHQEVLDGKWRKITRDEFDRQVTEIRENGRKRKEQEILQREQEQRRQQNNEAGSEQNPTDHAA